MHPVQPDKNHSLGPSGVQRERFNQPAEFFPCIFCSLKHTQTHAHIRSHTLSFLSLSVSVSHTPPSTRCQHFLLFDLCFCIASGPTAKRLKAHIKVLSAPSNLCSHRDVGFTSTSRVLGRFRVKRLKVRTRGGVEEARGGGGMLFTMADNKELLCIVAASPLLIGRWSRCTKSHIVKLRQKHMSRKSLSVLCCLGHSCYPTNNLYMYIYTVIVPLPRIWMMSLCDITKGSFLLVTPPPARCWLLPFETILGL